MSAKPTLYHECTLADATGHRWHHTSGPGRGPARCQYCGGRLMVTRCVWDIWTITPDEMDTGCATLMGQRAPDHTVASKRRADAIAGPTHVSRRRMASVST